ncbi:sugar transferase [Microbacterium sp. SD291]|uniref:sugar transferase n=1 Tax=Microbacterium sp. SD291 TaxID=2782007 RepID=UPI001A963F92|nr:sugar transferase [Microbacterium sp. SD291]MBO0981003.1 sugar transferase [Microbacterium sp. SD291]
MDLPPAVIDFPNRAPASEPSELPGSTALSWRRRYALRLWWSDLAVLVTVVFGTQLAWFGVRQVELSTRYESQIGEIPYWAFSAVLITVWMFMLRLVDSRDFRIIGSSSTEYARIANGSLVLFGLIAIVAFLLHVDVARGYLLISLPLGILLLVLARWGWRQWLNAQRRSGLFSARVLLVGSRASVGQIAREFMLSPHAGYVVVGACVPRDSDADRITGTGIPILGDVDAVESVLRAVGADTVAITSTDELPADRVKEISWALIPGREHLVLAPSIVDIAGPRIHIRPHAGLPLIHVETPKFTAGQRFLKRTFDVLSSSALILMLSPVLLLVALSIKLTTPGPLLFRHVRIGQNGSPFQMLKFRSMQVGADAQLRALLDAQGTTETPLFKVKDDPRITPLGRFLRKYSLDELPQLFNVLGGSMSLVGPRPQIEAEVALYSGSARRRLLARPGITGLWQVSGRSALDWEQAVRLDLYYVENWSLASDVTILLRTMRAVVTPGETAH